MRKLKGCLSVILSMAILLSLFPVSVFASEQTTENVFAGGDGTAENPYQVSTPEQLDAVRNDLSAHYVQINDIDLLEWANWEPIGSGDSLSGSTLVEELPETEYLPFKGSYNGQDYSIKNLSIKDSKVSFNSDCFGLFAAVDGGTVQNLKLSGVEISIDKTTTDYVYLWEEYGASYSVNVGSIAGTCYNSTISNCTVDGFISVIHCSHASVGGIVGYGNVTGCISRVSLYLNADRDARYENDSDITCGGITGKSSGVNGVIRNCSNYGDIIAYAGNFADVGGIAGENGCIEDCMNFGDITGYITCGSSSSNFASNCNIGGIVGATSSNYVRRCINYGNVFAYSSYIKSGWYTTGSSAGGIAGYCGYYGSGRIFNCINISAKIYSYTHDASGNEVTDDAGRIAGYSISTNGCYSYSQTLVNKTLVEGVATDKNGGNCTDEQLVLKNTYSDFDFEDTWQLGTDNFKYPVLKISTLSSGCGENDNGNSDEPEVVEEKIVYGENRMSFGKDITGYVGDEIDSLVVYTSANENIASLDIKSSNTDIVEIGTIEIGVGDYITSENEHKATIPLKLKAEGSSTITITSPEGVSESIDVVVQKSSYEIKLYSEVPAMVVGKGRQIGAAVQLENNGVVFEGNTAYSFVSSNSNIVSLTDVRNESDGTYFTIKGVEEGSAIITITENNTGAVFSGVVQVNQGILTFNAEALPSYYDRKNEYNGYIGGMYIDEFQMTEKDDNTMSVAFNIYNTVNIVGVVDVYDSNGNIIRSEQIKRFDGGYVTSIKDTLISGYKLIEDTFITGNILTYKQDSYSVKTPISIDVPKGGHIEITNDPLYSNTCAIFNCTEFITTSILMFGDVISVSANTKKEISEITGKNVVDKFLKEYIASLSGKTCNEKIVKLGGKFAEKLTEKSLKAILSSSITGELASFVDEGKAILAECDINLEEIIISSAGSVGIGIAEGTLKKAMGPFGDVLGGMFKFSEYASYSNFLVDICKSHENHALRIYFDDKNGCLSNNGVSIKAENGTADLSASNYVMHSIVLSNEKDLNGQMKSSLDSMSSEYVVRNIYLERDGKISQPTQPVQVTIPVPEEWIPDYCKLYWVQEDGTLEEIQAIASFNNLVFTTNHFSYYAIVYDMPTLSISGAITSFGDSLISTTVRLFSDGAEIAQTTTTSGTYMLNNISAGTYTLEVSKADHVTRTYEITVSDEDGVQNVKIHLLGDVTGDGKVNTIDINRVYAHVRETNLLSGYELECANVAGSGETVNTIDVNRIYAHVKEISLLW